MYTLFSFNALYSGKAENAAQLLSYIASGDSKGVLDLINSKKVDISARIEDGLTPLMFSIIYKQDEISKMLIEKGANINVKDKSGFTALIHSIMYNRTEISKILIEKKADVNIKTSLNENGVYMKNITPLILNQDKEIAKLLINAGADINLKLSCKNGDIKLENATPLMLFIVADNTEIAELLIESGADINAKDKDGKTALGYAREKNNSKIEHLLIQKGAK